MLKPIAAAMFAALVPLLSVDAVRAQDVVPARIIAVGINGAAAVSPVGSFHPGGPIHDKPEFAAFTKPGRVLDANRVLVSSSSNYGAPRARTDQAEGSVLSIDATGNTLVVPLDFARSGTQASALDGRVQLFSAQSPAFVNSVRTPGAASADAPAVSNPLGISINNAFGRLWFANTPQDDAGHGSLSIADPGGEPLAGAPSKLAGGVFVGTITNRPQQIVDGAMARGAIATALLGPSPDGGKRAVFAVLTADGAVAQAHAEHALDGLAPAGTVKPIALPPAGSETARVTRSGMIFNWVPDRILYITEPEMNAVTALTLANDDKVFRLGNKRTYMLPELNVPVDLAPAVPEVANPGFSSNTTMAGGSDMYVANRGNGTIVRLRQDGKVVAIRRVVLPDGTPLGAGRLNGIAVSPDAQKIWITVSGALPGYANAPGALLEVPAFGSKQAAVPAGTTHAATDLVKQGEMLFRTEFMPQQGLGPLFNERSCIACHREPTIGGMGLDGLAVVHRIGRFDRAAFDPMVGRGGPVARARSLAEFGMPCRMTPGVPATANLTSVRNAGPLYGFGLIDAIPDAVILENAAQQTGKGRPNLMRDTEGRERVGRFGWKADTASLEQFTGEAFRNELGITNPLAPADLVADAGCAPARGDVEDDGRMVRAVTAYIASLPPPASRGAQDWLGRAIFAKAGCASCHTPTLQGPKGDVALYSDLLLHDMGPALDDRVTQGQATGAEWRTTPLWGLGLRSRFLHDGRADSVREAILAHDGEAVASANAFRRLSVIDQHRLLAFLHAL